MAVPTSWNRDNPFPARLTGHRRLTTGSSSKDVRHLELELGTSGMTYEPGDTLGVWVRNDPALVDAIAGCCGLTLAESVELDAKPMTLEAALLNCFELTQAHAGFVKHFADATGNAALREISADPKALRVYLEQRQVIDILKQYPARVSAAQLLACLRRLTPRQYSIASSPLVQPQRIALTVNMVRYQQDAEQRFGAASAFLGWRVHEGDHVPVFVVSNPNFRLPPDPSAPVIMIGPGTGIAPFRAFLQHRAVQRGGANWLFFGNPHRSTDYLYEEELQAWHASGLLTRLELAFSRDQADKIYVQHRMRQYGAELYDWLKRGAFLYVCGDARHMAEDVQQALLAIVAEHGKLDAATARQYLVSLRQQKRYLRDVY